MGLSSTRAPIFGAVVIQCLVALSAFSCGSEAPSSSSAPVPSNDGGGAIDASTDSHVGGDGSAEPGTDPSDAGDDAEAPPHVPVPGNYIKASNTRTNAVFGQRVAISADGLTLAIGSPGESSNATGVNGDQQDTSSFQAGAVYVFTRPVGGTWTQSAYIKSSDTAKSPSTPMRFGEKLALSADGRRLAVGVPHYFGKADDGGAVYVFERSGASTWVQNPGTPLEASNAMQHGGFGSSVAFSGDGNTLAVGSYGEASAAKSISTGSGGPRESAYDQSGAAYLFTYSAGSWSQTHIIKTTNSRATNQFGWSIALNGEGNVLAVGAAGEASSATGVSGAASTDTSAPSAGAVYLFEKSAGTWAQTAYVKAVNTRKGARFGGSIALSAEGATLAVGSEYETSSAKGVNPTNPGPADTAATSAGAVYLFTKAQSTWAQTAYVKASNTRAQALFGREGIGLSPDGKSLVVGSIGDSSAGTGVNPTNPGQNDTSLANAGAAYTFALVGGTWKQTAYLKPFTAHKNNSFGVGCAITNGGTIVVSAMGDPSSDTGVDGTKKDTLASGSGAVYTFE